MPKQKLKRANGTGSISYLGKRRRRPWIVRFTTAAERLPDGSYRQERKILGYFTEREDAELALLTAQRGKVNPHANDSLQMVYDTWSAIKYRPDSISQATINNYKASWAYLQPLTNMRFADLRAGDYQNIIDEAGKTKSRSTLEKIKTLVVMLSTYGIENDIIDKNYGTFVKLPRATRSSKTSFTQDEVDRIEKAAAEGIPYADCILMLCYTGFRITEFLGLTADSYNIGDETLTGGIKTEAGKNRVIPVHPKIQPYLEKWLAKAGKRIICRENGSPFTAKYFREKCYEPALTKIPEVRPLDPHECRHTFATLLHAQKVSQKIIMALMGHSDPEIDLKTYIDVDTGQLREAVERL